MSTQQSTIERAFLSVAEAATFLGVSHDTISRRFKNCPGVINVGEGKRVSLRIPRSVLEQFIESRRVA